MKPTVHFPISSFSRVLVDNGETVGVDTVLIEDSPMVKREIIPVGKLLNIKPEIIHRHLKKKIGDKVLIGEPLAGVRTFFSSRLVKSPVSGKLTEIDLLKGTLTLIGTEAAGKPEKIKSPVKGKVRNITKTVLEIEVEGEVFGILGGTGRDVIGKLVVAPKESLGILDVLDDDVEDCIVASQRTPPDVIVKLEVIGVRGLIVGKEIAKSGLPWVEVNSETFKKLAGSGGKTVWLRPTEKQLVVID